MRAMGRDELGAMATVHKVRAFAPDPLDAHERAAVRAGRADAHRFGWDASLAASPLRRRWRALVERLTGIRPATPLADERLEMLRLFACMMRRDDRRAGAVAERLLAGGMAPAALHRAIALALA